MSNLISKEALRHLQQGQLFLLTILDRKFYVFAPKGSTPEALRAEMTQHDLGDVPDRCYPEIPNAAVTEIQSLDQISEQNHLGWLPYLFGPFGDYVNCIDPTVKECLELAIAEENPVGRIRDLLPISQDGDGDKICQALIEYLGNADWKHLDIRVFGMSVDIVAAFAKYEETGRVEDFDHRLKRVKGLQPKEKFNEEAGVRP